MEVGGSAFEGFEGVGGDDGAEVGPGEEVEFGVGSGEDLEVGGCQGEGGVGGAAAGRKVC